MEAVLQTLFKEMNTFKSNLFIAGAAKCGTTSLFEYLKQHSLCSMARVKEPDFFSHDLLVERVSYYGTKPVMNETDYHNLFDQGTGYKYFGEASVSYLPIPEVAERIHSYNPEARVIVALRNPVDRAYSHYKMDRRLGLVKTPFDEIVRGDYHGRFASQYFYQYVELGLFYQQLTSYFSVFGKDQILCIREDTDFYMAIEQILDFLELPDENIRQERVNESTSYRSSFLKRLYAHPKARKTLKKIVPKRLARAMQANEKPMEKKTRDWLTDFYQSDQKKLNALLENAG